MMIPNVSVEIVFNCVFVITFITRENVTFMFSIYYKNT